MKTKNSFRRKVFVIDLNRFRVSLLGILITDSQYSLYSNPNSESNDGASREDSSRDDNSGNNGEVQEQETNGSGVTGSEPFSKLLPGKE